MEAQHILPQPSQESADLANPPAAVECSALSKAFGRHVALDAIDLHVPPGSIFGLVGPNGAGKTTLLRILTGLSRASAGSVHLLGRELRADDPDVRRDIGYLPDVPAFYDRMTSTQALRLAGRLSGLDGSRTQRAHPRHVAARPARSGQTAHRQVLARHAPASRSCAGFDQRTKTAAAGRAHQCA